MATTKELRGRIKSIKNTSKITKAMELVSAAKMRKAQEQALGGRSYSQVINRVLENISSRINPDLHPLLSQENEDKHAIILISTNRGLCGSLNTNLFKKVLETENEVSFISIGKKGQVFLSKTSRDLVGDFELEEHPSLELAKKICNFIISSYLSGEFNKVSVIYTNFESTLKQESLVKQLLPILDLNEIRDEDSENDSQEYKFEPDADEVLKTILPHYILMEIYQLLLESSASEHSARMVAMKNASDNAAELVDELTLIYNQLRQESITNEILDISTAAVALE
jgi:F-type H+-transporting ATPase subunit gamma